MKKIFISCFVLGLSVVALSIPTTASAEEVGGWSETDGNYLNPNIILPRASVKHTGKRENKVISGTTNSRAHGWTTWQGVKHYTTAQMERYYTGKVVTTSGRKYGTSGTEAISPWFKPAYGEDTAAAKTYYGR